MYDYASVCVCVFCTCEKQSSCYKNSGNTEFEIDLRTLLPHTPGTNRAVYTVFGKDGSLIVLWQF